MDMIGIVYIATDYKRAQPRPLNKRVLSSRWCKFSFAHSPNTGHWFTPVLRLFIWFVSHNFWTYLGKLETLKENLGLITYLDIPSEFRCTYMTAFGISL